ncbi:MAG: glycosyltransferase family 2 protein [Actinomycetota bacterium]
MVSVIVPAYNEEAAIERTIAELNSVLLPRGTDVEIIVVDDGSTDRTAELAAAAGAKVLKKLENVGYGHSLKLGIAAASHDTVVITDADCTYPAEAIPGLLDHFAAGYDMVVGARTGQNYRESFIKSPLRKVLGWLVEFTVGRLVPDVNSGMRVFSRKGVMPHFTNLSDSFSFTTSVTLAYLLDKKYVKYVPIDYHKRVGRTKVRLLRDSLRTVQYIVHAILRYNPLKLFLLLALLLAVPGALLAVVGLVAGCRDAALFGGQAVLAAVLVFAIGLRAEQTRSGTHLVADE